MRITKFSYPLLALALVSALLLSPLIAPPSNASTHVIATTSVIYNDHVNPEVVITGSGFKANTVLEPSDFTIVTAGTGLGLTASSVSVNAGATEATIVFSGTALTGTVSVTAKQSAFVSDPGSASNTLSIVIDSRILLRACPGSSITVPCLQSGTMSRSGSSVPFRFTYSNNSGVGGASFSLLAEIETSTNVFAPVAHGDVATALVILYPTSSAVGGRLKTATWAMAGHKNFGYTKEIVTVNSTEVVKLTTSYEYINVARKTGCGVGSMTFGAAPQAACESVGVSVDYDTSADRSIDFLAATDLDWLVAETGADGGYLNYLGASFMWGSTADTPLRFQLVGPHLKSADVNDLNSGSFQVYLPAALVTYVYGATFNPNTDLTLTRQDEGVITETLSGTANVRLTQPNGADLLIDVPTHPFSAPVFTVSSTPAQAAPAPAPAPYSGPIPTNYSDRTPSIGDEVIISGRRMNLVTSLTIDGVTAVMSNQSADSFTIMIPEGVTSGLKDLVMTGPAGKLTAQGALTIQESIPGIINEAALPSKLNAGSFNGYVAVYAKGHKGKTLSWKIAGKWFKTTITSDYQVFQRKTAAVGLDVDVHLYIDGQKQLTKTVRTR